MTSVNLLNWNEPGQVMNIEESMASPNSGWTIDYLVANRQDPMVFLHLEVTSDGTPANGIVFVLPPEFAPGDTVTSADGAFTIDIDGNVTCVAGGGAGSSRLDVCYAVAPGS